MPVYRVCKIPSFARDRRLSYKARGLLAFILSHDNDWEVHVEMLINASEEDGRASVQTGLQELARLGYATLEIERDTHGHVRGKQYCIYDTPGHTPKHRQTENQVLGSSVPTDRKSGSRFVGDENDVVPSDDRQTENQVLGSSASDNDRRTINQDLGSTINQDLKPKDTNQEENPKTNTPPIPPKRGKPKKVQPVRQPMPKDWEAQETIRLQVFDNHFASWLQRRYPNVDAEAQWEFFANQCRSKGYEYLDFRAAFMNSFAWDNSPAQRQTHAGTRASPATSPLSYVEARQQREEQVFQNFMEQNHGSPQGQGSVSHGDETIIDGIEYRGH